MKPKLTYILSDIFSIRTFSWIVESRFLERFSIEFILLNERSSPLEQYLIRQGFRVHRIPHSTRIGQLMNFIQVFRILRKSKPDIVHTHLQRANMIGLTAAFLLGIPKRVYTRHYTNVNRLISRWATLYDLYPSKLATHIVVTCKNVHDYLETIEKVPNAKMTTIRFGFNPLYFNDVDPKRIERMKKKYQLDRKGPVIGVMSRYIAIKGLPHVIGAFSLFLKTHPDATLVLANAGGGESEALIQSKLKSIPRESYREIFFEEDCSALMKCFDVFIHVPTDPVSEAFGQVYVEPLLCKVPSVFTLSGVASEFIEDAKNALVVPYRNTDAIHAAMTRIVSDPELRENLIRSGYRDAQDEFPFQRMIDGFEGVYHSPR